MAGERGSSGRGRVRLEVHGTLAIGEYGCLVSQASAGRNQLVTVAMVFAVFTGFAFVLPFLPLFVRELGVEEPERAALWAGVLIGIAPLLAGLLAPVWGRLADRHGHKSIAVKALVSYVVILALCAGVTSVGQLLVLRVGIGLFGGIGPLGLAMATAQAPREETGRAVGRIQAAQILPLRSAPWPAGCWPTRSASAARSSSPLRCALSRSSSSWRSTRSAAPPRENDGPGPGFRAVMALPGVVALLVVLFVVNFIGRSFTPILPLHLGVLGVAPDRLASATGALIAAYSLAAATSAWTWAGSAGRARPGASCSSPSRGERPWWRRWRSCRATG